MKPDYAIYKFYIDILVLIVVAGNAVYTWWSNREKVTNKRFAALEGQVKEMVSKPELQTVRDKRDAQVNELKQRVDNIPAVCGGHGDMKQCYAELRMRVDGHNDRLGQHKELLNRFEGEFKHLPKHEDLEKIYERINKVAAEVSRISAEVAKVAGAMPGISHATELMNEFLINQGGKR